MVLATLHSGTDVSYRAARIGRIVGMGENIIAVLTNGIRM